MPPKQKTSFWQFNLGHLITISVTAIGVIVGYCDLKAAVVDSQRRVQSAEIKIEHIDTDGTKFSQRGVEADHALSTTNTHRIEGLESAVSDMAPKLASIAEGVKILLEDRRDSRMKNR